MMNKIASYLLILPLFLSIGSFTPVIAQSNELSLAVAKNKAMQNNNSLKTERLKMEKAKIQIQQALSSVIPNIKLDAGLSQMDSFQTRYTTAYLASGGNLNSATANAILAAGSPTNGTSLKLSSQLILGMHTLPIIQNSELAYQKTQDDYEAVRQSTMYQITQAYYNTLKAQKLNALYGESIDLVKSLLNQTQTQYNVGLITKSAVLRVEVRLKDTEGKLLDAQKMRQLAQYNTNFLIGEPLEKEWNLDANVTSISQETVSDKTHFIELAMNRPDMRSLYKARDLLKALVSITEANGLPVFALTGSYGFLGSDSKFTTDNKNRDWMIAGGISWNLFDGFSTEAKINQAKNDLAQMEKTVDLMKERVTMEVTEALLSIQTAIAQIDTAKLNSQFASDDLDLAKEKFKTGSGTNQDVLDSQFAYQQAQTGLLTAQFDLLLAKAKLQYVTGQIN